jgi:hypothetical protein
MMLRFALLIALGLWLGLHDTVRSQSLHFAATGCGPYSLDEEPLLRHYVDLVNRDGQSEFLVHLGDIVTGAKKKWPESQYDLVANLLKASQRPTFVVLGDNEWNDLDDPNEGLDFWNRHFRNFESHFPSIGQVDKQPERPENFAFVKHGVLVIGLNIVGGKVHDKDEWATRLQHDADWVAHQFQKHATDVRAAVLLAQAKPVASHELFFQQLEKQCVRWAKPVLYLHADGHVWQLEKGWRAPNLWRVQTDQVKLNPPVLVTVTEDASEPFVFDRRLDLRSQRELFVDDYLIGEHQGTALRMHRPEPKEVAIVCDAPWEGNISAYYTLFRDDDRFRMYYRGAHFDEKNKKSAHPEFVCYAESRDGIQWTKPSLGLVEFDGRKDNNILLAGEGTHNFAPFLDRNPACAPEAKYKALAGDSKGLKAYQSADGIVWKRMQDAPVITKGDFDSQNLAFWHPVQKRYLAYHRKSRDGVRDIMMSVSTNFLQWNDPRFLSYGDRPNEHLYTNAIQPYRNAPHLLVGFPTRFQPANQQVEPILMTSRDGLNFHRWADALVPTSAPQDRDGNRSNYMASGILELPNRPDEMSVYATEAYYSGPGSRVRRFTFRKDGLVSIHAPAQTARFKTKRFTFEGGQLHLNYRAHEGGSMRVAFLDATGNEIPGFSFADCKPLRGDSIDHVVEWSASASGANKPLAELENRPVTMSFEMNNVDLYTVQFR